MKTNTHLPPRNKNEIFQFLKLLGDPSSVFLFFFLHVICFEIRSFVPIFYYRPLNSTQDTAFLPQSHRRGLFSACTFHLAPSWSPLQRLYQTYLNTSSFISSFLCLWTFGLWPVLGCFNCCPLVSKLVFKQNNLL